MNERTWKTKKINAKSNFISDRSPSVLDLFLLFFSLLTLTIDCQTWQRIPTVINIMPGWILPPFEKKHHYCHWWKRIRPNPIQQLGESVNAKSRRGTEDLREEGLARQNESYYYFYRYQTYSFSLTTTTMPNHRAIQSSDVVQSLRQKYERG